MKRSLCWLAFVALSCLLLVAGVDSSQAAGGPRGGRGAGQACLSGAGQQAGSGFQHRYGQGGSSSTTRRSGGKGYGGGSQPQTGGGTGAGIETKNDAPVTTSN